MTCLLENRLRTDFPAAGDVCVLGLGVGGIIVHVAASCAQVTDPIF